MALTLLIRHSSVHRASATQFAVRVACNVEPTSTSSNGTNGESGRGNYVDTRIHWGNSTEGWIGIEADDGDPAQSSAWGRSARSNAGILDEAPDSHFKCVILCCILFARDVILGVSPDAEMEEIKFTYRWLSKQYHPDTTSLPLEIAAQKFMRLKDAYDTLSDDDLRNVYDSRLENKIASSNAGRLHECSSSSQQGYNAPSQKRPERVDVDTLGGRNMPLSGQTLSALAFDLFVLFICICVIVYVAFFKNAST